MSSSDSVLGASILGAVSTSSPAQTGGSTDSSVGAAPAMARLPPAAPGYGPSATLRRTAERSSTPMGTKEAPSSPMERASSTHSGRMHRGRAASSQAPLKGRSSVEVASQEQLSLSAPRSGTKRPVSATRTSSCDFAGVTTAGKGMVGKAPNGYAASDDDEEEAPPPIPPPPFPPADAPIIIPW